MVETYGSTSTLVKMTCWKCSVTFGLNEYMYNRRQNDGDRFYCPNGHSAVFGKTEADRLKKQLAQQVHLTEQREAHMTRLRGQLKHTENSLRSTKGAHTKTKKRIANGVCPCCNRTFVNLKRHMNGQHPDYAKSAE